MGSDRTIGRLGDHLAQVIDNRGKTPPNDTERTDYELLEVNCLTGSGRRPNYEVVRKFVTKETYDSWFRNGHPKPNDVIISTVGSIGEVCISEGRGSIAQNLIALSPEADALTGEFLYYYLCSREVKNELLTLNISSVQPSIKVPHLLDLEISLPPLPEQKAIAHILGSLDDKIELNRRMNATLEGMAQALFKSWFVDFDPVIDNALAAGNPIPDELAPRAEVRKKALAAKNSSLSAEASAKAGFPASFQCTEELGWIPVGWEATAVSNAISVNPSTKLKKGDLAPFADMKALPTSGYAISGVIEKAYSGGAKFQNGDVLLARITPCLENGKTGVVDFLTDDDPVGFGSTEFIVLRGEGDLSTAFIACLARDSDFRKHCEQSMIGSSGRQRVHNSCFDSYYLALPKYRDVVSKFNDLAAPSFAKAGRQSNESKILAKLRDTLLPKLISGDLRTLNSEQVNGV